MRDLRAPLCAPLAFFCALAALLAIVPAPASGADEDPPRFAMEPQYGRYIVDITSQTCVNITVVVQNLQDRPDSADVYCMFCYGDDPHTLFAQTEQMGAGGEAELTFQIDIGSELDAGAQLPVNFTVKRASDESVEDGMVMIIRSQGYYGFAMERPVLPKGDLAGGGFVDLHVRVRNTGNVLCSAMLTLEVDGEPVASVTDQVFPGSVGQMDIAWDRPIEGTHWFRLVVQALVGYNGGDINDPMLSEELDVYEFSLMIAERSEPFNWAWVVSGLVAVLLVIILIVAIKIKRRKG